MATLKEGLCPGQLEVDRAVLFDLLISQLTDFAVFVTDPDGCIQTWNPGVERLFGYREAEWIGYPIEVIFTPEDRQQGKHREEITKAFQSGCAPDIRWHQRKDGSRLFIEGTMVGVRDDAGKLIGYAKVMRDVTERQHAEQERERLTKELQRSNEELAGFAHTVSHDLQAPLRGVISYTQLLQRKAKNRLTSPDAELLRQVTESTNQMQMLVKALLSLAQVGQGAIQPNVLELDGVLTSALLSLRAEIEEAGAQIHRSVLPVVHGDFTLLKQLFQNLIGNALKYRRPGRPLKVSIQAEPAEKHWMITVQDNGQGIEQEYWEEIFEPMKRLHGKDIPGTGLGLALCQRIVYRHGGAIWVESQVDRGSLFRFTLPIDHF